MTSTPDDQPEAPVRPPPRPSWRDGLAVYTQPRVLIVLLLGFSSWLPLFVALGALLVATMSSTQDIVVDAFRVESLPESEQAAGMASYVAAYRIGMLVSTAGALFIVSGFESAIGSRGAAWMWGYVVMAALGLIGTGTALAATQPEQSGPGEAPNRTRTALKRGLHPPIPALSA